MLGGALALLAVPTVRLLGEAGTEDRTSLVLVLSVAGKVLSPDGIYALNVIDSPPLGFLRAELATLGAVFPRVAVLAPPWALEGAGGANFILLAADRPLPLSAILEKTRNEGDLTAVRTGRSLRALVGGARVLTDDHAPVDQLINID